MNHLIPIEYNTHDQRVNQLTPIKGFAHPKRIRQTARCNNEEYALVKGGSPACWWVKHNTDDDTWTPYVYAGWDTYDPMSSMRLHLEIALHSNDPGNYVHQTVTPLDNGASLIRRTGIGENGERWDWTLYVNGERRALIEKGVATNGCSRGNKVRLDLFKAGRLFKTTVMKLEQSARDGALAFVNAVAA